MSRRHYISIGDSDQSVNVQFTLYRPRQIPPEQWCPILAFAHLDGRRPDAPKELPDPLEEVKRQAAQVLDSLASEYQSITQDSRETIPREGEMIFVLNLPDLRVNPSQRSFLWLEDVHREEFRVMASSQLDGRIVRGSLQIFLGALLIAEVNLAIRVNAQHPRQTPPIAQVSHVRRYPRIFASYSHRDESIVRRVENYARTLGNEYIRDLVTLRSGEVWTERLAELIRDADVFQLFWSRNSMVSTHVRQEWEYALSLARPNFVRPTYWELPMPEAPERGLPPEALKKLHFYLLALDIDGQRTREGSVPQPTAQPAPKSRLSVFGWLLAAIVLALVAILWLVVT